MSPNNFTNFITYGTDRGLQLESTFASVLLITNAMGLTSEYTSNSYGSFNLSGSLSDSLASICFPLILITVLTTYFLFYRYLKRNSVKLDADIENLTSGSMPAFLIVTLLLFVIFNKVMSTQYMIWLIPPVIVYLLKMDEKLEQRFTVMTTFLCILCLSMILSVIYDNLCHQNFLAVWVIFFRNLLLIVLITHVIRYSCFVDRGASYYDAHFKKISV